MRSQWRSNLLVGIFVVTVLSIFMYFIMNYTNELGMFEPTTYINTTFKQPVGLFDGAAVQLNNVKVGRITNIRFAESIEDNTVYVTMIINVSDLPRIGKDAVATISTVGLLGDNVINIEAGDPIKKGHIEGGDYVQSKEFKGLLGNIDLEGITSRLEKILDKIDKGGIESISSSMQNVSDITGKINNGEGTIGKLISSDDLMNRINGAIDELHARISEAKKTIEGVNSAINRVNEGPGSVHRLLYEDDIGKVMEDLKGITSNLEEVSKQVNDLVKQVQDEEVVKKIGEVTDNLASASQSVENIAKSIEDGEGTVGALIKDPTLYEDLKVIMQGAKRSKALQYAIQHTIQQKQKAAEEEKGKSSSGLPPVTPRPAPLPSPMTPKN